MRALPPPHLDCRRASAALPPPARYQPGIVPILRSDTDLGNFDDVFTHEKPQDSVAAGDPVEAPSAGGGFMSMFSRRLVGGAEPKDGAGGRQGTPDVAKPVPGVPDQEVFDDFAYVSTQTICKPSQT